MFRLRELILLAAVFANCAWAEDRTGQQVLAKYDSKKITVEQFAEKQPALLSWLGIGTGAEQVKTALEDSILESLVSKEAQESELLEDPAVKAQVSKILFAAYMKQKVARDTIEIQEPQVIEYYETNKDKYRSQEQVKVSQIVLSSMEMAEKAGTEAKNNNAWNALCAKYSIDPATAKRGGQIGLVPPNSLLPEIRQAIKLLAPGEISSPVKTAFGYHLVRLDEKPTISYRPLEEVKKDIYAQLFNDQKHELMKGVKADLWKKYNVSLDETAIDALVKQKSDENAQVDRSSVERAKRQPGQATELQVISESLDLGKVPGKKFNGNMLLANTSNKDITIERVGSTCKCINVTVESNKVSPGQIVKLQFTYDPLMFKEKGRIEKLLFIESSDSIEPRKFVRLNADVG